MPPEPFGPDAFRETSGVSRETLARLKLLVGLLEDWNSRMNLVSAKSLEDVWKRHVWDSAQLAAFVSRETRRLADLGSGAGFPGLVLAAVLMERGPVEVVLFESTAKKCRFLEHARDRLGLPAEVRNGRIEQASREPFDVVTARACAPLAQLLAYAFPFQDNGTQNLFLKGQGVVAELTNAHKSWSMVVEKHASRSDPSGVILDIRELRHAHRHP